MTTGLEDLVLMAGRNLGEAFVVISPDTSSFLGELIGKVKAAVSGVKAEVKVPPVPRRSPRCRPG